VDFLGGSATGLKIFERTQRKTHTIGKDFLADTKFVTDLEKFHRTPSSLYFAWNLSSQRETRGEEPLHWREDIDAVPPADEVTSGTRHSYQIAPATPLTTLVSQTAGAAETNDLARILIMVTGSLAHHATVTLIS